MRTRHDLCDASPGKGVVRWQLVNTGARRKHWRGGRTCLGCSSERAASVLGDLCAYQVLGIRGQGTVVARGGSGRMQQLLMRQQVACLRLQQLLLYAMQRSLQARHLPLCRRLRDAELRGKLRAGVLLARRDEVASQRVHQWSFATRRVYYLVHE